MFDRKKYRREYYLKNKDKNIEYAKKWQKNNKNKIKDHKRSYYLKNRENIIAKVSKYNQGRKKYLKKYNKEYAVKYNLKRYGLTPKDYILLLEKQKFKCKICKRKHSEENSNTKLVVDHDHDSGKIRGLLCRQCNCGLGLLNTKRILTKAIKYLDRNR